MFFLKQSVIKVGAFGLSRIPTYLERILQCYGGASKPRSPLIFSSNRMSKRSDGQQSNQERLTKVFKMNHNKANVGVQDVDPLTTHQIHKHNSNNTRDWSKLPQNFLSAVCDRLDLSGLFAFNRVCSEWRYSSSPTLKRHLGFLLIVQKDFSHQGSIWVFSPLQFKFYNMKLPSEIKSGNICGFSDGWLALEDDHLNLQMRLVFSSKDPIHLPPLLPSDEIEKIDETAYKTVCMSADQSVFMAIDRCLYTPGGLYIYRPMHHVEWILIKIDPYDDLIFFKGMFYAVNDYGRFTVVDPFSDSSPSSWTMKIIDTRNPCGSGHFVEISGELRVVRMDLSCFFIMKLENGDLIDTEGELGDHALLLNRHHSCLVPLSEFPCFKAHYVYAAADPYTKFNGNVAYYSDGRPFGFIGKPEYFLACQYDEVIEFENWLTSVSS